MNSCLYQMSRRDFLGSVTAALAATWLVPPRLWAVNRALIRKPIPASGELVPAIGMGTSLTFDAGSSEDELAALAEVLRAFFENGGSLIDSSPMYGSAEQVIGRLLDRVGFRDQLFAATKVWTDGRQAGVMQMEDSMHKWGLSRFDLMQIHNLRDWQIHLTTLKQWQTQGKIRYTGITTSHGRDHLELAAILRSESLDFVQFSYNIENRDAERELLPLAADRGMAVLVNRPYQRGGLFRKVKGKPLPDWAAEFDCTSWGQFFLKYIVAHPAVTCVIPATTKVGHMQDNMAAGFGRLPDAAMRKRMVQHYQKL